jgi:hypothetical protein
MREITVERSRQVVTEGFDRDHDDEHHKGELAQAAACYALRAANFHGLAHDFWPWSDSWWKPYDTRRDLIRAAALIVAEIERLDRLASKEPSGVPRS